MKNVFLILTIAFATSPLYAAPLETAASAQVLPSISLSIWSKEAPQNPNFLDVISSGESTASCTLMLKPILNNNLYLQVTKKEASQDGYIYFFSPAGSIELHAVSTKAENIDSTDSDCAGEPETCTGIQTEYRKVVLNFEDQDQNSWTLVCLTSSSPTAAGSPKLEILDVKIPGLLINP